MTTTEQVSASESAPGKSAPYYVVPVKPSDDSLVRVMYFENDATTGQWKEVSAKNLNAKGDGKLASIKLTQPDTKEIIVNTDLSYDRLDGSVQLFAGVAKTLMEPEKLPSLFCLDKGSLTIPVEHNTVRGLILVFSKHQLEGGPNSPVMQLIASPDPEVKNGTGGN